MAGGFQALRDNLRIGRLLLAPAQPSISSAGDTRCGGWGALKGGRGHKVADALMCHVEWCSQPTGRPVLAVCEADYCELSHGQ
jgi:hypothetical protein